MIVSAVLWGGWLVAAAALVGLGLSRRVLAARRDALARACHELRGPLTAVTLGLELLDGRDCPQPGPLRGIELELGRAALALEDLEAVGRGCAAAERTELVDVRELLNDSVEAWRGAAARRGIELRLRWFGPSALVTGHRVRLAQATGNLIANAIEHGGGEVVISGRVGAARALIEVLDDGPGLAAPVAEVIRQAARDRRREHGRRRGHGLRIAETIATAHGGRLAAAPSDSGARLVLDLPVAAGAASAQAEAS